MQTILGTNGAIGPLLAKELRAYTNNIRLVSRNPRKVHPEDQLLALDLTDPLHVKKAVEGSEVVYVTIGFPYKTKIWSALWIPFIQSVIQACKENNARLVFFDNMYMYDAAFLHHMTEKTPVDPLSQKGKIRAKVASLIMDEVDKGGLQAVIARAADFYGPAVKNSVFSISIVNRLQQGKAAQWLGNANTLHNYTYTPDAAKATAILGNTPDAFNQVWHLPSSKAMKGKEWIELFARELNQPAKYMELKGSMLSFISVFIPVLREIKDIAYQVEYDYFFDSSKFEKHFQFQPTSAEEAAKAIIAAQMQNPS